MGTTMEISIWDVGVGIVILIQKDAFLTSKLAQAATKREPGRQEIRDWLS
jgi:hypothetical protein